MNGHAWTPDETARLIHLSELGVNLAEIARQLDRSYQAIRKMRAKLRIQRRLVVPTAGRYDRFTGTGRGNRGVAKPTKPMATMPVRIAQLVATIEAAKEAKQVDEALVRVYRKSLILLTFRAHQENTLLPNASTLSVARSGLHAPPSGSETSEAQL